LLLARCHWWLFGWPRVSHTALVKDLDRLRKRFTQDTLYATDTRLI
jgi:hypothetical protein